MKTFEAIQGKPIPLGRLGENERLQVLFDVSAWLEELPGAAIGLINRLPHAEEAYPVILTYPVDGKAGWTITSAELSVKGDGDCELIATVGTVVAKSEYYRTVILDALDGSGEVPDQWETYQAQFTAIAGEAEAARAGSEAAQTAAETAQGKAEDAQAAAETAQGKAEDAQEAAEAAQAAAETAQEKAEDAQEAAEAAQTAAETAQGLAEDAAELAQTWATGGTSGTPSATNNAEYWAGEAQEAASDAAASAQEAASAAQEAAEEALAGKADKVQGGTNGHLVSLVNGNIADSGHAADDYAVYRCSMQTPANNGSAPRSKEESTVWFGGHYFTDNARLIGYNASQWKYLKSVDVSISSKSGTEQSMTISVTVIPGAPAGTLEVYIADTIDRG